MTKNRLYYLLTCGLLGVIAMLLVFYSSQTVAQTTTMEINLVAGGEAGEYYSIAKDIEKLGQQNNLDIDVIPSRGALQNIHDVFTYKTVPLGITQSDVLAFLNTFANDDEMVRLQAENLRTVLPLYREEIHLITRQDIKSVQELVGKTISIGEQGSGTSTTASTLLYQWGIMPQQLLTYDIKRAIDALRDGEIDGLFYVVGMPAKVLEEQILPEDNFHIVPISLNMDSDDDFYKGLYSPITIEANSYSWQKESVKTLAIQSFLITTVDQDCQQVTPVAKLIRDNLSWLQQNGSAIWKQVDLNNIHDKILDRVSQCPTS